MSSPACILMSRPRAACRAILVAWVVSTVGAIYPVLAGPLGDITKREALPSKDQQDEADEAASTDSTSTELPSVIVKGKRQQEEETIRQKLEKAIKPKEEKPLEKDLNKAGESMKDMATWQSDPDAYRNHPGDPTTRIPGPVGDETGGCGADITKGCKPR